MPSAPADIEAAEQFVADRPDPKEVVRRSFVKGLAILLPLVVTLLVVSFVLGFVFQQLRPLAEVVVRTSFAESEVLVTLLTVVFFLVVVFAIGFYTEFGSGDGRLTAQFDEFMASIPGVGSVYTSFNEMSELLLDSDTDSFQDVKLVEYPGKDSYVVAFKTADTPDVIAADTGNDEMITLFMPMAPNPVMGGFVIHVSTERVVDVDLTVEQGIRSIVTSGVAIGDPGDPTGGLSESEMRELGIDVPADRPANRPAAGPDAPDQAGSAPLTEQSADVDGEAASEDDVGEPDDR